ncbi:TetR/AcrR family transcriptional regulator [Streptomyces sp. SL13]|uniref:TetR/AcrR family transcriptional regulator n=1 Tax=Streptantibioticus silvisoli TaxID=2705255 RepID=A0AA90GWE0_9ACTN|nr:TetR/AcrR family transcriptional regulator [Streptantibioticus silvisoli]MDI5966374.1 TetR/AcrR family transcriptional regulator [Streptantibioticus silvisoli]MDI5969099.1 TetR/AcrR family transcriptional regulator [Streptantibioticus silvisoli]
MTSGRRKRVSKDPEARRGDILRAARNVFDATGFTETRIADITEAAGIAKGTFYLHFRTKEHVLGALWSQYLDEFYLSAERILARGQEWWSTIDELLATLVRHVIAHAELRRLVYGTTDARVAEVCAASNERLMTTLSGFIAEGAAQGAVHAEQPEWVFSMVYHGAERLLDNLISTGDRIDGEQVLRCVLDLAHRALGGPPLPEAAGR